MLTQYTKIEAQEKGEISEARLAILSDLICRWHDYSECALDGSELTDERRVADLSFDGITITHPEADMPPADGSS